MSDELLDVVNARDEVIGTEHRSVIHALGLFHRAVHVLVFDPQGRVFLQLRGPRKDRHPNVWDSSASGHVDAGESYDTAAGRELAEELRIQPETLQFLFGLEAGPDTDNEFVRVYRCMWEGPITFNSSEIAAGRWFTPRELTAMIESAPAICAPALIRIWRELMARGLVGGSGEPGTQQAFGPAPDGLGAGG